MNADIALQIDMLYFDLHDLCESRAAGGTVTGQPFDLPVHRIC